MGISSGQYFIYVIRVGIAGAPRNRKAARGGKGGGGTGDRGAPFGAIMLSQRRALYALSLGWFDRPFMERANRAIPLIHSPPACLMPFHPMWDSMLNVGDAGWLE
ncbi:hypothetical protein D3C80_1511060 [compost metagenome]